MQTQQNQRVTWDDLIEMKKNFDTITEGVKTLLGQALSVQPVNSPEAGLVSNRMVELAQVKQIVDNNLNKYGAFMRPNGDVPNEYIPAVYASYTFVKNAAEKAQSLGEF